MKPLERRVLPLLAIGVSLVTAVAATTASFTAADDGAGSAIADGRLPAGYRERGQLRPEHPREGVCVNSRSYEYSSSTCRWSAVAFATVMSPAARNNTQTRQPRRRKSMARFVTTPAIP